MGKVCGKCGGVDRFPSGECRTCKYRRGLTRWTRGPCRKCGSIEFSSRGHCKPCRRRYDFTTGLKRVYGISRDQFNALAAMQGERCAICEKAVPLVIDHCHKTNKIRGLLCGRCNSAIGFLYDDVDLVRSAVLYLSTVTDIENGAQPAESERRDP